MKTEVFVTLISFFSTFGLKVNESAGSSDVMCRAVRNLRKDLISQLTPSFPEVEPSNCGILDNCSTVDCAFPIPVQRTELLSVRLDIRWCNKEPFVKFSSNSSQLLHSRWARSFALGLESEKVEVPWNLTKDLGSNETPTWFLTVNLPKSHSQTRKLSEIQGWFVSLEAILEMCQGAMFGVDNCSVLLLVKIPPISLSQVCDDTQGEAALALTPKHMDSLKAETLNMNLPDINLNLYTHSHSGKKCAPDEPFSCGIGGNCRMTKSSKEGLCECLKTYEYDANGSCIASEPDTPPDADTGESSSSAIWGAFFAIGALILIGAFIFYGIRYNLFRRLKNRLPLYFNFCIFRRGTVLEVNDQVSMVNPLYSSDSDDPPLL